MRLLICTTEFLPSPGGIAVHIHQLAHHFVHLGWHVTIVTPQDHASDVAIKAFNAQQSYGVIRQRLGRGVPIRETIRFLTLMYALLRERPDIVIADGERAIWSAALAAKLVRTTLVVIGNGSEFIHPDTPNGRRTRRAFEYADAAVPISYYTKQFMDAANIKPRNVTVIQCGADGEQFQTGIDTTALRRTYDIPDGPILLTVGAVKERKAHDVVIKALPQLVREFPDLTYLIAGRPFIQENLTELAESLGVAKHVRFLGPVAQSELPALYSVCDIFVMVSRTTNTRDIEGYGIVAVEAALCGKPSVVTRDCGLQEAVHDGETGILVHQNDPEETAAAIGRLLRDETLREAMGRRAQQRASTEATWDLRARSFDHLLRSLISG